MSIEAWVTTPAGIYKNHLDRSAASPFRGFAVSRMRGADPGTGSLQHHLDNDLTRDGTLLADGNLVWMRYRSRTMVWVIEQRAVVLDEQEHQTDWVRVSGRGAKQLLADRIVWPTAFSETTLDPALWGQGNQWRRFINRAAGEMLWDLISESNGRSGFAPIVRGTVETTGADGWTQDLRFDNLLDVAAAVSASYGEVDMDGLTFNYYTAPGTDRSATVIFEEGADLLKVERTTSDRDTITWAVAEGVGEGVTAKLAFAKDITVTRRREGYIDAKDAGNLPLVQLRANVAIAELTKADSIAVEVAETRFEALTDYDLHDTVRVIAPSRGIDETAVIVAVYLAEDGDRVRVGFDVNTPRQEILVGLEEGAKSTARSLGVRNRQPQGQLVPYSFSGGGILDSGSPLYVFVKIPTRVSLIVEVAVSLAFRQFLAPATAAASGGADTSGASSASTSNNEALHTHQFGSWISNTPGAYTKRIYNPGSGPGMNIETSAGTDLYSFIGSPHSHGIPHTHSTPNHTHGLTYGTFEETFPASHSVTLKVYERVSGTWTLRSTTSGITADFEDVDLTAVMINAGDWRLTVQSAGGQPNGGRLGCDVYGAITGAIQSE
jgi:hypothetical protein